MDDVIELCAAEPVLSNGPAPTPALSGRLADVYDALVGQGYRFGPPPGLGRLALEADLAAAAESACEQCNASGLTFLAFHRPGSYRGLAVCSRCGWSVEM